MVDTARLSFLLAYLYIKIAYFPSKIAYQYFYIDNQ